MRPLVRTRSVALCGLAGLGCIAALMLRGTLDLVGGAGRAAVLLGLVLVVERVALPVARVLVGDPRPPDAPP